MSLDSLLFVSLCHLTHYSVSLCCLTHYSVSFCQLLSLDYLFRQLCHFLSVLSHFSSSYVTLTSFSLDYFDFPRIFSYIFRTFSSFWSIILFSFLFSFSTCLIPTDYYHYRAHHSLPGTVDPKSELFVKFSGSHWSFS